MKHIAILGANGQLGHAVMLAFHAAGYQVIAVTRRGRVHDAPRTVKQVAADAMNLPRLKKAVRGADFVFNGINPAYSALVHTALPLTRNVLEAVRSTRAIHLFPGSLHNYGKQIPALCEADTPVSADGVKARTRIEMEKLFQIAANKYRVQTLLIRAGDVYGGKRRGSWFDQALADKLANGQFVYPGPLDVPHTWAYLPDLANAFVTLAEQHQQCAPFENILYPGHSLSGAELKTLFEQACGRELEVITMPWRLIKFGSLLVPVWREMSESAYLWSRPHRLCGQRLEQLIGKQYRQTSPALAVQQALQDLGKI